MNDFILGQRWLNDSDLSLGLGIVVESDHRTVAIAYPLTGETRVYAKQGSPLTRITFAVGDQIANTAGELSRIESIEEAAGLIIYHCINADGSEQSVAEIALDPNIQLNRPAERLFNGQLDNEKWFRLRVETWQEVEALASSPTLGLQGARASLIPHQLYVANKVASRYAPRVLLADEVGLGKTIEAGLILHQQILNGLVARALLVVPNNLLHQWLVEMRRRFQLAFRLMNEDTFLDIKESGEAENPFFASQLVLCSLEFLCSQPAAASNALDGQWDMLVVDEAHHLQWSEKESSLEYDLIDAISSATPGVLLLTGTPQQLGKQSHFARLRLLDPERYSSFAEFETEEAGYQKIAPGVQLLLARKQLSKPQQKLIEDRLASGGLKQALLAGKQLTGEQQDEIIAELLDLHGTGRVLFRNTRAAVGGFPEREVNLAPLPAPNEYSAEMLAIATPESRYTELDEETPWTAHDPRIEWLEAYLREHRQRKTLLIAAHINTVLDLYETLRVRMNLHAAMFHEDMSIVERDRAAAFFADSDDGTQILLCSEIGSEGRNFQFAQDLVLFDLPENPDLLEQRIGRIDRIGQQDRIRIHVPYIDKGAQKALAMWYHMALNALNSPCPSAFTVYQQYRDRLLLAMRDDAALSNLIKDASTAVKQANQELEKGRDVLLEANSCRPAEAQRLKSMIEKAEMESDLPAYLDSVFDAFGVNSEAHSEAALVLRPSGRMREPFPHLQDDGITITWLRDKALAHEDMQFITWEHDMVQQVMERVLTGEKGNSTLALLKHPDYPLGDFFLECLFVANVPARLQKYMARSTVRLLIDAGGQELGKVLSYNLLNRHIEKPPRELARKIMRAKTPHLKKMCERAIRLSAPAAKIIADRAIDKASTQLNTEISRLKALKLRNPNVRDEEIEFFEDELQVAKDYFATLHLNIDGLRVIIAT
ncbi:MAG: RNA polymerase-associated protein RapA [Proteobacteria bacterium]|jgi:ATP-dependent helicase HepA|nr:RNA polymerase-associated protein RapA [Pseudomonadota bacterium]